MLMGLADLSETAWRKRLRASNDWLLWLLSEFVPVPEHATAMPRPVGRVLLVDASCLRQPGGRATTGDCIWPMTSWRGGCVRCRSPTGMAASTWIATRGRLAMSS